MIGRNFGNVKIGSIILVLLLVFGFAVAVFPAIRTTKAATSSWTLVTNARPMKAYPNLLESVWQANATMAPNGPYDKIQLHRLVQAGVTPQGVVFIIGCPVWGTGTFMISNPATDNWTKTENYSQAIFWANRGFDVYAIDFRTFFIPAGLNFSQMSFMANWGWDQWVSDIKQAADQVKAVSGAGKFFMVGQCTGAEAALNYATKYWQTDLKGIILEDLNFQGVTPYPVVGNPVGTNSYNLTQTISNMNATNSYAAPASVGFVLVQAILSYALQNPGAPAQYPPGTPLQPTINPKTNATWNNITEYVGAWIQNGLGNPVPPGWYSNINGGVGNVTQIEYCFANQEVLPNRLQLENVAMADWINCPYMTYDYNDHYKEIGVPILAFGGGISANFTGTFNWVRGTASSDFAGVMLNNYGHLDVFFGTNSAKDVSQPALNWMVSHYQPPSASAFCSVSVMRGQTWMFFVQVSKGTAPYKFQWYEGSAPIAGQTDMVLSIAKTVSGTYTYYCQITDADGTVINSNTVTLTVT